MSYGKELLINEIEERVLKYIYIYINENQIQSRVDVKNQQGIIDYLISSIEKLDYF